jgi:hypothetical protein
MSKRKKVGPKNTQSQKPASTPPADDTMHRLLDAKIEIPVGLLRQKHIFIATPCYGGQIGEPYFRSMMRLAILCNKYDINFTVTLYSKHISKRKFNHTWT